MNNPKRIAIVGPECSGKTSLCMALSNHYKEPWVPEYAREYLDELRQPYGVEDLDKIAAGQLEKEDTLIQQARKFLICDTTLLVIKIWSEFKYGNCSSYILEQMAQRSYDLTLLTYVDIPWENDPQREHPDKREALFEIYVNELKKQQIDFTLIKGEVSQRLNDAVRTIDNLF